MPKKVTGSRTCRESRESAAHRAYNLAPEATEFVDFSCPLVFVLPSPATHAILRLLTAGEGVFQTLLLAKTVFHAPRGAQPLFPALFGVKTLSGQRL